MKVSYEQGVASRFGSESCVEDREVFSEALTGESAGRLLSLENFTVLGADVFASGGRQQRASRYREGRSHSAWSKTPCMHRNTSQERTTLSYGSREIPGSAWVVIQVRAVNSQEERRR